MPSALERQWRILQMLPEPPRRIDTATIEQRLRDHGIFTHRRTIQRDLLELACVFPIVADERAKPYGWRWATAPAFRACCLTANGPGGELEVRLDAPRGLVEEVLAQLGAWSRRAIDGGDPAARVEVVTRVRDTRFVRRVLLGYGGDVEVVSPATLRCELAIASRASAERYGDGMK